MTDFKFKPDSLCVDISGDFSAYLYIKENWHKVRVPKPSSTMTLGIVHKYINQHATAPWYRWIGDCYFSDPGDALYFKLTWA